MASTNYKISLEPSSGFNVMVCVTWLWTFKSIVTIVRNFSSLSRRWTAIKTFFALSSQNLFNCLFCQRRSVLWYGFKNMVIVWSWFSFARSSIYKVNQSAELSQREIKTYMSWRWVWRRYRYMTEVWEGINDNLQIWRWLEIWRWKYNKIILLQVSCSLPITSLKSSNASRCGQLSTIVRSDDLAHTCVKPTFPGHGSIKPTRLGSGQDARMDSLKEMTKTLRIWGYE